MIPLLAVLSASAAAGIRIAVPLLLTGLLYGDSLWSHTPILENLSTRAVLLLLVSWSLFELLASKRFPGQRILQLIQLFLSPLVGALMGLTVAHVQTAHLSIPAWVLAVIGGLTALSMQLVQAAWFYELHGIPPWVILLEDILCGLLVVLAFHAPAQGGLLALLILWLVLRSAGDWRARYLRRKNPGAEGQRWKS